MRERWRDQDRREHKLARVVSLRAQQACATLPGVLSLEGWDRRHLSEVWRLEGCREVTGRQAQRHHLGLGLIGVKSS